MASNDPGFDLLIQIENKTADRRILEFAARGLVPLPPPELVRAVSTVLASGDSELAVLATDTFQSFDADTLKSAVLSKGVRPEQLDVIARKTAEKKVLEPLIQSKAVSDETLAWLAERIIPDLQDVLVTNQARLLAAPVIVERLFENPQLSTDIKRRADEFLEEFFLKPERERQAAAATPAAAAKASDASPEAGKAPDAAAPADAAAEGPALTPAEVAKQIEDDENQSLLQRVTKMSVMQRIKLAYGGNREERLYLVRDKNRLVSTAVLKSPKTSDADAEAIACMKSVSEDVLRAVSMKREWMRKYSIVVSLVKNARAPIDVTVPLVARLTDKDQKALAGDKNVPEAVRALARRAVARKLAG